MTNTLLSGLRILDLSRILAGPFCTQLLGDMGADVIKVEKPGIGDDTRLWGPPYVEPNHDGSPTESAYYLSANRNKRSIAVDMRTEGGQNTIKKLMSTADIVIENFKPGGLKQYGLDYEQIKLVFPSIVWCSISGFGQTGPNAHKPGYDLLAQGFGGLMSITGQADGEPTKVGVGITDICTGLYSANAILAAIHHRDKTGKGQRIDIALVDVQMACLANQGTNYLVSGASPKRQGNAHPNIVPYEVFELSDGYVIIAVGNDEQYQRFCTLISCETLATDSRFKTNALRVVHREKLIPLIAKRLLQMKRSELLLGMEKLNIPGGPIHSVGEALDSEQAYAREMRITLPHNGASQGEVELVGNPLKFSETPVSYRRAPPVCGEHTQEILDELADM